MRCSRNREDVPQAEHGGDSLGLYRALCLTLNTRAVHTGPMNPHIWRLHAKVFELARARGLPKFRVNYRDGGGEVVIALVMAPANDTRPGGAGEVIPGYPR
jgi:hypothetical protein